MEQGPIGGQHMDIGKQRGMTELSYVVLVLWGQRRLWCTIEVVHLAENAQTG